MSATSAAEFRLAATRGGVRRGAPPAHGATAAFVCLVLFAPPAPAGVKGELILASAEVPGPALTRFVESSGGARILVLVAGKETLSPRIRKAAGKAKVEVRPVTATDDGSAPDFTGVGGVWIAGDDVPRLRKALVGTDLEKGCRDILARGGVVAAAGPAAGLLARTPVEGKARGCDLLPGVILGLDAKPEKLRAALEANPGRVGCRMGPGGVLVVRGRVAAVEGRGKVHFYDGSKKPAEAEPDHESLGDGGRYDLEARKVLPPAEGK